MATVIRGGGSARCACPCVIKSELPRLVVTEEAIRLAVGAEFCSVLEAVSAHRMVHGGIDRMSVGRPQFAANRSTLVAVDVKAREAPGILPDQVVVVGWEAQGRQIEAAIFRIRISASDEAVVAVARVDDYRRREQPDVIKRALPRFKEEPLAGRGVAIVVVVVAVAIVPTPAPEDTMFLADNVVYADRVREIFDRFGQVGLGKVTSAI